MISYNEQTKIFQLDSKSASYVIGIFEGGYILHYYYGAKIPTGEAATDISGSVSGIRFYGASLVLKNKIAVRFYFTGSIEGLTFSQGTPDQKGNMYYVEIADICPQDLDQDIVISVTNGSDTLTVTYSALDYIIRMYAKGGNSAPLVQALYGYYLAAEAYTA